jgi:hypothetical protein
MDGFLTLDLEKPNGALFKKGKGYAEFALSNPAA